MKMTLLTVGKTGAPWIKEALDIYSSRLSRYVRFSVKEIPDLKKAASLSKNQVKEKEGERILQSLKDSDRVVLLDERGKEMRSVDFAKEISGYLSLGKDIVFVIGGAYGFSDAVYSRSEGMLSLSRMTFSHQMARAIFAEQLYRAFTILKGEPYHHEG